jgi:hypothetical protein
VSTECKPADAASSRCIASADIETARLVAKHGIPPPAPSFGQPRPQAVIDKVGFTVDKIRAAGKVAGTLVTADELPYWLEKGVQFFYVHSDPFLRLGLNGIKKSLGR